jgi:hypothetical protein
MPLDWSWLVAWLIFATVVALTPRWFPYQVIFVPRYTACLSPPETWATYQRRMKHQRWRIDVAGVFLVATTFASGATQWDHPLLVASYVLTFGGWFGAIVALTIINAEKARAESRNASI